MSDTRRVSTETFVCENCGGLMKFSILKQKFACESCGAESTMETTGPIVKNDFHNYLARERETIPFEGMATVSCQRCGMEISFDEKQIAATCPMCDSTQVATVHQKAGIPPDGVVPFKIDKKDAQQKFKAWVRSRWFAPNDFKKRYGEGDLNGMYLPFWTYDADVSVSYSGKGGKNEKKRDSKGKQETKWTPINGNVSSSFNEVQICASSKYEVIKGVLPYDTSHNTQPFSAGYLSGYYAEVYKVKADTAFGDAKKIMEDKMKQLAKQDILSKGFDRAQITSMSAEYNNVTYKHLLLPLWESAFGYSGKTYQYIVNGETGKVSGNRPYSMAKIAIAAIVAIIIVVIMVMSVEGAEPAAMKVTEVMQVEFIELEGCADNAYFWTT